MILVLPQKKNDTVSVVRVELRTLGHRTAAYEYVELREEKKVIMRKPRDCLCGYDTPTDTSRAAQSQAFRDGLHGNVAITLHGVNCRMRGMLRYRPPQGSHWRKRALGKAQWREKLVEGEGVWDVE